MRRNHKRLVSALGVFVAAFALGACEDAFGPGIEVDVGEVVLHVGGSDATVPAGGSGTLIVPEGSHEVSITVRDRDGRMARLGIDYQLAITTSSQAVARYSPLANLEGTLVTAPGTATLQVRLRHGSHDHFNAPVAITVN